MRKYPSFLEALVSAEARQQRRDHRPPIPEEVIFKWYRIVAYIVVTLIFLTTCAHSLLERGTLME